MAATSSVIVVDDESVREGSRNKPNKIGQVDDTVHSRQEDVDQHVHVMLHLADRLDSCDVLDNRLRDDPMRQGSPSDGSDTKRRLGLIADVAHPVVDMLCRQVHLV